MNCCYDQMVYSCRLLTPFFHSVSYGLSSFILPPKGYNQLTGSIPTEIGMLSQLLELVLCKSMLI